MKTLQKILSALRDVLPHLLIALSVVLLSFFILDRFNRAMNFINNDHTKRLLVVYGQLVAAQAVLLAVALARSAGRAALIGCITGVPGALAGEALIFISPTEYLTYEEVKWTLAATVVLTIAASVIHIILRRKEKEEAAGNSEGPEKTDESAADGVFEQEIK